MTMRAAIVGTTCLAAMLWTTSTIAQQEPSPWVGELNLGVPRLETGNFQFVGNARLGYVVEQFGGIGRGSLAAFDVETDTGTTETLREDGYAEGWFRFGEDGDSVRLELRASGGAALYTSTYTPSSGVANAGFFHDEDSFMVRGGALAGVVVEPDDKFVLQLRAGGGVQFETYDYLTVDPADPNLLTSTDNISGRGEGRLRARWRFLPDTLAARAEVDGSFFTITRSSFAVGQAGQGVSLEDSQLTQVEVTSRLFIDIDASALFEVRPSVFGGPDYFSQSGDVGSESTLVPVVGIGLLKPDPF